MNLRDVPARWKTRIEQERCRLWPLVDEFDARLAAEGVPVDRRLVRAIEHFRPDPRIYTSSIFWWEDDHQRIFRLLHDWFGDRYGVHASGSVGPLGRLPFLFRGALLMLTIPLRFGNPPIAIRPLLKDASDALVAAFDAQTWQRLAELLCFGLQCYAPMERLRHAWLSRDPSDAYKLFAAARDSIDTATDALAARRLGDAAFQAQQAAEKAMKAYLVQQGVDAAERRRIGHNLDRALDECCTSDPDLDRLRSALRPLRFGMGVRYAEEDLTLDACAEALKGAALVAGSFARRIKSPAEEPDGS